VVARCGVPPLALRLRLDIRYDEPLI